MLRSRNAGTLKKLDDEKLEIIGVGSCMMEKAGDSLQQLSKQEATQIIFSRFR